MQEGIVQFKGRRDGLELLLDEESEYGTLKEALVALLNQRRDFFNAGNMKVRIAGKELEAAEKEDLKGLLCREFHMEQVAFEGEEPRPPVEKPARPEPTVERSAIQPSVFLCNTVRSGQRIESQRDIVIIGDVNPGSELVAVGSIAVMGTLRGLAHAGATGDESAVVVALKLRPRQLRIGSRIAISPEDDNASDYPEMARVRDGEIVIEPVPGTKGK